MTRRGCTGPGRELKDRSEGRLGERQLIGPVHQDGQPETLAACAKYASEETEEKQVVVLGVRGAVKLDEQRRGRAEGGRGSSQIGRNFYLPANVLEARGKNA